MKTKYFLPIALLLVSTLSFAAEKNQLLDLNKLQNTYIAVRHGESVPSSEQRICSSMKAGRDPHNGLTEKGREEVKQSIKTWIEANRPSLVDHIKNETLIIVSSPFSRTMETSQIMKNTIIETFKPELGDIDVDIQVNDDLRERYFGKFEGQINSGEIYKKIWEQDKLSEKNKQDKVETPIAVQSRSSKVIAKLEKKSALEHIYFIVAHGDTLKILQTAFQKQSPAVHATPESVAPYKTAEFRELHLTQTIK